MTAVATSFCVGISLAQSSASAPGAGGAFQPGGTSAPAPGAGGSFQPNAPARPAWGGPWGGGWQSSPPVMNPYYSGPDWSNSGVTNVVAVGYDAQGVYRTIPLTVSYVYNGINYNVTVLNAWNPWTDMWNTGVDDAAFATTYYLNGQYYDYYTILSTGTYYFNL